MTEVNKLNKEAKNLKGEYYRLMSNRWGPRWTSGLRVSMVHGEKANRLNKNIKNVGERMAKVVKNMNAALNRNVTSLKAEQREVQRAIIALYKNRNAAAAPLETLNAKARRAQNANEKARIEREKIPHKVVLKRWRNQKAAANAERNKLMKNQLRLINAMEMRRKILARGPTENQARKTIGRFLSRTIVPQTLYGPYGTRTLSPMRRFPGYKEPTLEKYAEAMRQINRLKRTLKRKRNNK
jgi:gas vesicle protein